jgi:hypothetical protein
MCRTSRAKSKRTRNEDTNHVGERHRRAGVAGGGHVMVAFFSPAEHIANENEVGIFRQDRLS